MGESFWQPLLNALHDRKEEMQELASMHPSRELSLAITKIQESIMWLGYAPEPKTE